MQTRRLNGSPNRSEREIKLHCYRMLGSLHEADDLVQETYLRAWRSFDSFEEESFRAWLYRIATNACLNALAGRKHVQRLLPDQLGPATAQMPDGAPATDVAWLEPYPDSNLEEIADDAPNPGARYASREAVQLAFVAVIQQLPPRQRASLLVVRCARLGCAEAATLLGGSIASINSALQRRRGNACQTLSRRPAAGAVPARSYAARAPRPLSTGLGRPRSGRLRGPPQRGRDLHHAAVATMVCGARGNSTPSFPWLGRPVAAFAW